jgi:hypothetical protein
MWWQHLSFITDVPQRLRPVLIREVATADLFVEVQAGLTDTSRNDAAASVRPGSVNWQASRVGAGFIYRGE